MYNVKQQIFVFLNILAANVWYQYSIDDYNYLYSIILIIINEFAQ